MQPSSNFTRLRFRRRNWDSVEGTEILCKKKEWQSVILEPGIGAEVEFDESIVDLKVAWLKPSTNRIPSLLVQELLRLLTDPEGKPQRQLSKKTKNLPLRQNWWMNLRRICPEWLELSCKCWAPFYAYLVQYYSKRRVPLGLPSDESTGLLFSLLRLLDVVGSLVLLEGRLWD